MAEDFGCAGKGGALPHNQERRKQPAKKAAVGPHYGVVSEGGCVLSPPPLFKNVLVSGSLELSENQLSKSIFDFRGARAFPGGCARLRRQHIASKSQARTRKPVRP